MFGTGNSSGKSKGYSLVLHSPLLPMSHGIWGSTPSHRVCLHEGQGTGKHPGYCSLLLIHHCVSKCSFPAPSNGLVLRQRQQTCNFSFLFIRAQKAIQVLSMWCSLAPWGSAKHGKPRWKLSGTVRLVPLEGIPNFQGDSPISPGAHC